MRHDLRTGIAVRASEAVETFDFALKPRTQRGFRRLRALNRARHFAANVRRLKPCTKTEQRRFCVVVASSAECFFVLANQFEKIDIHLAAGDRCQRRTRFLARALNFALCRFTTGLHFAQAILHGEGRTALDRAHRCEIDACIESIERTLCAFTHNGAEEIARFREFRKCECARCLDGRLLEHACHESISRLRTRRLQETNRVGNLVLRFNLRVGDVAVARQHVAIAAGPKPCGRVGAIDLLVGRLLLRIALHLTRRPELRVEPQRALLFEDDKVAHGIRPKWLESWLQLLFAFGTSDGTEERLHAGIPFFHRLKAGEEEHHDERENAHLQNAVRKLERFTERLRRRIERIAHTSVFACSDIKSRTRGATRLIGRSTVAHARAVRVERAVGIGAHRPASSDDAVACAAVCVLLSADIPAFSPAAPSVAGLSVRDDVRRG